MSENGHHTQSDLIVWMDLEMSGLDPTTDIILEIATIITDKDLNVVAEGPDIVINADLVTLNAMSEWCREHHKASNLWEACLASRTELARAEELTLEFLKQHVPPKTVPLAGNSIWQDRRFLAKYMPAV